MMRWPLEPTMSINHKMGRVAKLASAPGCNPDTHVVNTTGSSPVPPTTSDGFALACVIVLTLMACVWGLTWSLGQ